MERKPFDESIVSDLEQAIVAGVEDPTDRKTSMQYTARVNEEYSIDVDLMTYTPHALPYGVAGFSHKLFLCRDVPMVEPKITTMPELGNELCGRPVLFSVVYSNDEDGRVLQGMSGSVKLPFADILALRSQDRELAITTGNLALQLSEGDHFEMEEKDPKWDEQLVQNFLRITSLAVASGVYIDTSYKAKQVDGAELFASYITFSGDPQFISQTELEYPYLRFSVVKGSVEEVYERSLDGKIELKTRIADPIARYAGLESFQPIYDDDGEPIAAYFDYREAEAIEAEERASGLFVPTHQQVAELTEYARMLSTK